MQIIRGFENMPQLSDVVATVGSYDGVHAGHCHLLQATRSEAERRGGVSLVVTFDPHPRLALNPDCGMKLLTSLEERVKLFEEAGIDYLLLIHFDRAFSRTSPEEFVRSLVEEANVKLLVVGYDHRFGCDKGGDKQLLESLGAELGFEVRQIQEQGIDSEHLSSTTIRRHVERGEIERAASMLTHPYMVALRVDNGGRVSLTEPNKLLPLGGEFGLVCGDNEYKLFVTGDGELTLSPLPKSGEYIFEFK